MPKYAIAGLGVTPQGVLAGTSAEKLAWDAVELALADAGLERRQVNGYIYQPATDWDFWVWNSDYDPDLGLGHVGLDAFNQ